MSIRTLGNVLMNTSNSTKFCVEDVFHLVTPFTKTSAGSCALALQVYVLIPVAKLAIDADISTAKERLIEVM